MAILNEAVIEETDPYDHQSVQDLMDDSPPMDSPDWSDWVMGQFSSEELVGGLPNVAGLRRVAQKLLGPITRSVGKPVQSPSFIAVDASIGGKSVNWQPAVSSYEIDFIWTRDDEREGRVVTYGDVGSCWEGNCDSQIIQKFLSETATTRSEARCLRKALGLKAIAAEEQIAQAAPSDDMISSAHIFFIDSKCRDLNLDVKAFVNAGKRKYNLINEVPYETAVKMAEALGEFEREGLPEGLRKSPYKSDWREKFSS